MKYRTLEPGESDLYKYELLQTVRVELGHEFPVIGHLWVRIDDDGFVRFRSGYQWDGASGPTIDDGLHECRYDRRIGRVWILIGTEHVEIPKRHGLDEIRPGKRQDVVLAGKLCRGIG